MKKKRFVAESTTGLRKRRTLKERGIPRWFFILALLLLVSDSVHFRTLFGHLRTLFGYESHSEYRTKVFQDIVHEYESLVSEKSVNIPAGEAVALPSVRVEKKADSRKRGDYGGKGDKLHLGGFVDFDVMGVSPSVWKWMIEYVGVKSLVDVGCGRGISTSWFLLHDIEAQCVEGSHDAVSQTIIPEKWVKHNPVTNTSGVITEHDYSRGPWWPRDTVDAVWSVEFLEHVGRNFHHHYLPTFRKAAILYVTSSNWGGWHHVEVHENEWWITKFEMYGFRYSDHLTKKVKEIARAEQKSNTNSPYYDPKKKKYVPYNAQHVWLNMKVFINPIVAALPQHAHLLTEYGCFVRRDPKTNKMIHRECGFEEESILPKSFEPLQLTEQMDDDWENLIKQHTLQ